MPKRKQKSAAARKAMPKAATLMASCPPVPQSFAKLPADKSWAADAWRAAHTLLDGVEQHLRLIELARQPGGVQLGKCDTSILAEMDRAFLTMKRIDPGVNLQGMPILELRRELHRIVSQLEILPDSASGKRGRERADAMRAKRKDKFSDSRESIREECRKRIEKNPGLKGKPTTLRDVLYRHFLRKGKQQKGYSQTAIYTHIRDLCDPEK